MIIRIDGVEGSVLEHIKNNYHTLIRTEAVNVVIYNTAHQGRDHDGLTIFITGVTVRTTIESKISDLKYKDGKLLIKIK